MVDFEDAMIVVVEIFLLFRVVKFFLLIFDFFFVSEVFVHCLFLGILSGIFFVFWF